MIKNDVSQKIGNFAGENFSTENYFFNLFEGVPFTFNRKKERLKDVKNIIQVNMWIYYSEIMNFL